MGEYDRSRVKEDGSEGILSSLSLIEIQRRVSQGCLSSIRPICFRNASARGDENNEMKGDQYLRCTGVTNAVCICFHTKTKVIYLPKHSFVEKVLKDARHRL